MPEVSRACRWSDRAPDGAPSILAAVSDLPAGTALASDRDVSPAGYQAVRAVHTRATANEWLQLRPLRTAKTTMPRGSLVDESFAQGFPISVSRSKWDAADLPLEPGDAVVVGLKQYRVLPHYPLSS